MKCPYCNKDMERGYIKSNRPMFWGKDKELGFLPNDIKLTRNIWKDFIVGSFVDAYRCNSCRKIIASIEEYQNNDE